MTDLHDLLAKHRAVAEAATKGPWFDDSYSRVWSAPLVQLAETSGLDEDSREYYEEVEPEVCGVPIVSGDMALGRHAFDATHIALNDPEVALALNRAAEVLSLAEQSLSARTVGTNPDTAYVIRETKATLTQLHEVMQRKIGDEG